MCVCVASGVQCCDTDKASIPSREKHVYVCVQGESIILQATEVAQVEKYDPKSTADLIDLETKYHLSARLFKPVQFEYVKSCQ